MSFLCPRVIPFGRVFEVDFEVVGDDQRSVVEQMNDTVALYNHEVAGRGSVARPFVSGRGARGGGAFGRGKFRREEKWRNLPREIFAADPCVSPPVTIPEPTRK